MSMPTVSIKVFDAAHDNNIDGNKRRWRRSPKRVISPHLLSTRRKAYQPKGLQWLLNETSAAVQLDETSLR
jgi:hypothetical protein